MSRQSPQRPVGQDTPITVTSSNAAVVPDQTVTVGKGVPAYLASLRSFFVEGPTTITLTATYPASAAPVSCPVEFAP